MSDKLEVEIGANIKELESKLSKAQKDLTKFSSTTDKNLDKFTKSSSNATKGIDKLGKGAISGSSAMTSFNRTIQDAPFGLMGVSNNITNLTEQFGYLKAKTGSSGSALKAMLKDLKGFGGISFGISLATSLLLVFGDKIFKTKDGVKELRKAQEDLTKSLDDYIFGLESVEQARLKGTQSAQKELLTLKVLKSTVEDTTKSTSKRNGAINELRKIYPDYLSSLSDEEIKNGSLTGIYDELTTSILKRARATASSNMIIKNSTQLITLESKLLAKQNEIAKQKIVLDAKDTASNRRKKSSGLAGEIEKLNKLREEENALIGQKTNLELANIDLEQNIDLSASISGSVGSEEGGKIRERVNSIYSDLKSVTDENIQGFNESLLENPIKLMDATMSQFDIDALTFQTRLALFAEETKNILNNGIQDGFADFGASIGNAIGNGTNILEAAGASLLGTLGGIMVKYGKLAIAFGIASEAVSQAFKNPFGGGLGAIAGGIALVAVGSALSSFASSNSGSSSTSSNATSSGGTSSFSGGSSSGFSSGSGSNTVVFEIAGNKLVGVLSETLRRNRSLGGDLSLT